MTRAPVTFLLTPLVLGATGRIGRVLRYRWGVEAALWQTRHRQPGAQWRLCDPLGQPDVLVSTAQAAGQILCLAGSVPGRGGDLADNTRLAEAAVRAGAAAGVRVVLVSSSAVYGAGQGPLTEETPLTPANPYGVAKAEMEARACALATELGVEVAVLRIGNIAGFDAILGGWRPGFRLDRFTDGRTPRRSYIGVLTLADVIAAVLDVPDLPGVLNIAQPGLIEMGALLQAAGRDFATVPAPPSAIPEVALDLSRLSGFLAPRMSLPGADPARMVAEMALLEPHMKETLRP
ncbi:NAD-dependent epimerase/dehydratase family protein [Epibacterium sp. MM17-32]|uniref:NAD-dependent epimerase/dehydratase family protein n=1 Tax=Epibacterium sp. MM17-32 TaxID=2917734 RepID=UPI001EF71330|nr:NAD-dependent epimerase/dehydratase family protein [Epibacterium sp. MM17-32]MCG7630318.1 NAD-dependent epimerase/dehydratase family protein [Epibacterium sp. MM17-32]